MKGALKTYNPYLSKKFFSLNATAKQARIAFNGFNIPRDFIHLMQLLSKYEKDKVTPYTKWMNLYSSGLDISRMGMIGFQEIYLLNLRRVTKENKRNHYIRNYSYFWLGVIFFSLHTKGMKLKALKPTEDKEKDAKKKKLMKLSLLSSFLDVFPALSGTGLMTFPDMVKGAAGASAALLNLYVMKQNLV